MVDPSKIEEQKHRILAEVDGELARRNVYEQAQDELQVSTGAKAFEIRESRGTA